MANRRILLALIALLSIFVVCGATAVAGLFLFALPQSRPNDSVGLLVLHADQRLTLLRNGDEQTLAEDSSPDLFRYPTIAPDREQIAYIGRDANGVTLHRLNIRTGARNELYRSPNDPPLYAAWSANSRYVSFLVTRSDGLSLYVVPADGSTAPLLLGQTTGSSYFAWQPEGEQLLAHIGGSSFERGRVATFAPDQVAPLRELRDPGFFQAPAWAVDGESFFYVAQPQVQGGLSPERIESVITQVTVDGREPQVIARESQAAILFLRSPQSNDIAYITINDRGYGALKLAVAGEAPRLLSGPDQQVNAFFWSPDGSRIAYITGSRLPGSLPRYQWHMVDVAAGTVRDLEEFTPSAAFTALVSFFDAYAASFDLWSPNSRELVYAAQDGVYVLDAAGGTARRRSDGVLGLWVGE